jgi:hypothetical protein
LGSNFLFFADVFGTMVGVNILNGAGDTNRRENENTTHNNAASSREVSAGRHPVGLTLFKGWQRYLKKWYLLEM